jgi:hypothetical protein
MNNEMKIYEFKETKNRYRILNERALFKDTTTREWKECIIYTPYETYNPDGTRTKVSGVEEQIYVREKEDFYNKFKEVLVINDD